MTDATLFTLFEHSAKAHGTQPAVLSGRHRVSYKELYDQSLKIAGQLQHMRDHPGAVAIRKRNLADFLAVFFACAAVGRPALPLDSALPARIICSLAGQHPIAALFSDRRQDSELASLERITMRVGDGTAKPCAAQKIDPSSEFYWGLTSGTTGTPKLFARSHASWIASFEIAESVFPFLPNARTLIPGPLHHSLFLYGAVHALCRGHTIIMSGGQFRPDRLAEALGQASYFYAVPFMLSELLKTRAPAPRLRRIFCGGAKLPDEVRGEVEERWPQADLAEFYGASETSFVTFHSTLRPAALGSVGRAFPEVEIEIRGADGHMLPQSKEGRIFVRSPMLFSRYVGESPSADWVSVGDMGFLDSKNSLHLTGRSSRIINSKALKIHPEAVEAALITLPEIQRAAVIDLPDPLRGSVPIAIVEFEPGQILPRRALAAHCRERLGRPSCPKCFYETETLPLTSSGKVAIAELRDALMSGSRSYRELT